MSRMDDIRRETLINARAYAQGFPAAHEGCGGLVTREGSRLVCDQCDHPVSPDRVFTPAQPGPEAVQDMLDLLEAAGVAA